MHGFSIHGVLYTTGKKEKNQTMNEKNIQQSANEFVTAFVNTLGKGTIQDVVKKNFDDALDIESIMIHNPNEELSSDVAAYLKELAEIVKNTSMDTRHDLGLAFPPSHFSSTDNPLMLFYKSFYDTVAYYTALIQATPEVRDALIDAMADKGYTKDTIDGLLKREWDIQAYLMNFPQIAETCKALPDYSDYNQSKTNNYSLQNAKRKIEHMIDGQLVEKGPMEQTSYQDTTDIATEVIDKVFLEECLALLSPEDRGLLTRHYINGETLTSLAKDYGYVNASGVRKRIERIKKQITEKFPA